MRVNADIRDLSAKIAALLRLPLEQVQPDTELAQLITDSFVLVELIIDMQEEFGVRFEQQDMQNVRTVADIGALVERRQAA